MSDFVDYATSHLCSWSVSLESISVVPVVYVKYRSWMEDSGKSLYLARDVTIICIIWMLIIARHLVVPVSSVRKKMILV